MILTASRGLDKSACIQILSLADTFRDSGKIRYYGFMANANSTLLQVQQKENGSGDTNRKRKSKTKLIEKMLHNGLTVPY